ncbi:MAG: hypothetical protein E6I51_02620 [Chloroflexi bacterium]|nr:MAG: hypothetical protein E6I51_02620 [Chloroflexota bacterium]
MKTPPHRSEAERTLLELAQRARLGFALGTIGIVAVARQVGGIPDDLLVRAIAVAGALLLAAAAQELTTRLGRFPVALTLGIAGDVVASSLAVVLLADRAALAPAALLWPIFSGGLVLGEPALLFVAFVEVLLLGGTAIVLGPGALPLEQAVGWALLLLVAAAANGELIRRFRAAQRVTEVGFARAADLVHTLTADDVADVLFPFVAEVIGVGATPRLLLREADTGQRLDVVAHAHLGASPAAGAKRTLTGRDLAQDQGVWFEGGRLARDLGVDDLARYPRAFAQPLTDGHGLVGIVVVSAIRHRHLGEEARRSLERVAAHAASALSRIDLARMVERQREALTVLLDTRDVPRDDAGVARWALDAVRRISGAGTTAFVRRRAGQLLCERAEGIEPDELLSQAMQLLGSATQRPVPLVIPDTSTDDRYALGPRFARGSIAAIPVAGAGVVLFLYDELVDRVSSSDLELLVMLAHQLSLLLTRPRSD